MAAARQLGGRARRNELLVGIRSVYDMAGQVAAAVAVAALLGGYVADALRLAYVGATVLAVLLQVLTHRSFAADRARRERASDWLGRLIAVYALNGAVLGAAAAFVVQLPQEPAPLLALMCLTGMIISVSLTTAAQLPVSAAVMVPAIVPTIGLLILRDGPNDTVLAAVAAILLLILASFAIRLNRYYRRSTDLVERLRQMIQDRTRISTDAEAAQLRLRSILDTAPFPIIVVRRSDGVFLYSNRPAADLFGIEDAAGAASAPRYALDPVHWERIFGATPLQPEEEMQITTAQGRAIWATIATVPMVYGENDAALLVVNDITAKKASEQRLREAEQHLGDALAVAPDGVALFDADARLVVCNRAYAAIIGVPYASAPGTTHDAICEISVANRPAPLQAGVRTDYSEWLATRRRTFADGNGEPHIFYDTRDRRWLQIRDFRLESGGRASLITDITALKRGERELREANENLERHAQMLAARTETLEAARTVAIKAHQDAEFANRAKSQFLAHMSHELRTPLNAIIGFSEIMALRMLGPSQVPQYDQYAADILAAGRHLLAVIDDILDISKIEAGKMKLAPGHVPWIRLAEECMTLLRPLAADRMVRLELEPCRPEVTFYADERLAKQMLVNLLSNAVKYTPAGGWAAMRITVASDGEAEIEVRDSGVGMTPEDLQKALEPFGRIDSALVSQMRGTGLGLPLVKALIELHGGKLVIESQPGQGTLVRLVFPPPARLQAAG